MASAVLGKAVTTLIGFLAFAILARQLGAEGLGQYRIVLTVLAFAALAGDFGLYQVALRKISQQPEATDRIVGNAIAARLACTSIAVGFALLIAWVLDSPTYIQMGLTVTAAGWVAYQGSQLFACLFQVRLCQHYAALAEVVGAAVGLLALVTVAAMGGGVTAMLAGTSTGFIAAFLASVLFARRLSNFRLEADFREWWGLMSSGLTIAASMALVFVHVRGDLAILAVVQSAADVGTYDIAQKFYEISALLAYIFGGLVLPMLTRDHDAGTRLFTARLAGALTAALVALMGGMALLFIFAEQVAVMLGGIEFIPTAKPLRILAGTSIIACLAFIMRFAAMSLGRQRQLLLVDIVAVSGALVAYAILIPKWSYIGAAFGKYVGDILLLAGSAMVVAAPGLTRKMLRPVGEMLLALAVMIAVVRLMSPLDWPWMISASIAAASYLLVLAPMKGIREMLSQLAEKVPDSRSTEL